MARLEDREALLPLWLDLIEHHRRTDPDFVTPRGLRESLLRELGRALRSDRCRVWVARRERDVDGFALAEIEASRSAESSRDGTCWIHELYVVPQARRQGIGRALAAAAEQFFRERGASQPTVRVEASNRAALRFWKRAGFSERARILERRG